MGEFAEADGSPVDQEWAQKKRVRMIDESSVSSLSGCGNTPVPPQVDDDEETAERMVDIGMDDDEDLATPAQELPPPWPQDASHHTGVKVEGAVDKNDKVGEGRYV